MKNINVFRCAAAIAFSAILFACGNRAVKTEIVPRETAGEVVFEDIFIGVPSDMLIYGNLMMIRDMHEGKALTAVDRSTGTLVGRCLNIGRGPGEVSQVADFSVCGDRLYAYLRDMGHVNIYSLPDFAYIEAVDIPDSPDKLIRMGDHYLGDGAMTRNGRLQIFDAQGKYLFAGNDYPDGGENSARAVLYQGDYCVHPAGNRYVFAATYSDKIEFRAIRDGVPVMVAETEGPENVKADWAPDGVNVFLADDRFFGSAAAWGGAEYCYLLYIGKNRGEEGVTRGMSDTVRQYNWDGELVAVYKLDRPVASLAVDEPAGHIYGFSLEEDGNIVVLRFDMGV